jgi:lipoprotein-releasing system ATP-binding protein
MNSHVLELHSVTKDYEGAVITHVLRQIDLSIRPGEFVALIGPSGSGKSTLLNILGLLDRPTSGSVKIDGRETTNMSDGERTELRGTALGFVFQFHHLLGALTTAENVMLPLAIAKNYMRRNDLERARALLDSVGLLPFADKPARTLSGGQQQRAAVARALIREPHLVLADEPTGNLDTAASDHVFSLMRSIHARGTTAFLIVTHDPRLAERCDRVITMVDGTIESDVTR